MSRNFRVSFDPRFFQGFAFGVVTTVVAGAVFFVFVKPGFASTSVKGYHADRAVSAPVVRVVANPNVVKVRLAVLPSVPRMVANPNLVPVVRVVESPDVMEVVVRVDRVERDASVAIAEVVEVDKVSGPAMRIGAVAVDRVVGPVTGPVA